METSNKDSEFESKYKENSTRVTTKSSVLLPILFILTVAFTVCSIAVDGFTDGLNKIVIWAYFSVVILYAIIANVDNYIANNENKKKFAYTITMSILCIIADIFFIIFINK